MDGVGNGPSDWKPMSSVGPRVREIRVHVEGEYRVLYVAQFAEGGNMLAKAGMCVELRVKKAA